MRCVLGVFLQALLLASSAQAQLSLELPWLNGESWALTCGYGCGFHTDALNSYYALDFDKPGLVENGLPQPVLAPVSGRVVFADLNGGFGYSVKIDAGNGVVVMVSHLRFKSTVSGFVMQGQPIGIMGGTGTGGVKVYNDHIHLQFYFNGRSRSFISQSKPEPMSGYTDFQVDRSYVSDNVSTPSSLTISTGSCAAGISCTGPQGTTYIFEGIRFTPTGAVRRFIEDSSGNQAELLPPPSDADSTGKLAWSFTTSCATPTGTFSIVAVDLATVQESNRVTETITPGDCAPPPPVITARDDLYTMSQGTTLTVPSPGSPNLLDNDSIPAGATGIFVDFGIASGVYPPPPGSFTNLTNFGTPGGFVYQPPASFVGTVTLHYYFGTSNLGISNIATVTVNVNEAPPPPTGAADAYVDLGNTFDEALHNLAGWGAINPGLLPVGIDPDRTSRYQRLREVNSVDVFVPEAGVPYTLSFRTEDGLCDDSFDVYVNGHGPIYSYRHRDSPDVFTLHSVGVDGLLITSTTVRVAFVNRATDSCGLAAVYFVKLASRLVSSMDDDFNDDSIDLTKWSIITGLPGANVTEVDQQLQISLTPFRHPVGLRSRCSLVGDFDIQVEYSVSRPADNSFGLGLSTADTFLSRDRLGVSPFEVYRFFTAVDRDTEVTATSHVAGALRLIRSGATVTGHVLDGTSWVQVGSGPTTLTPKTVDLEANNGNDPIGGILITFDNFKVNAGTPSCPP